MPERIATAEITAIDPQTLEVSPEWPGTYGFYVRLSHDPGVEWAAEFDSAYHVSRHPLKPPVVFRGDTLCVFFLPLYKDKLPDFLEHLENVVKETNASVEQRNQSIPDDHDIRESFRAELAEVAESFKNRR
ncbi:MAG: hypothetical protein QM758_21230 [Armatimonas sp.]